MTKKKLDIEVNYNIIIDYIFRKLRAADIFET